MKIYQAQPHDVDSKRDWRFPLPHEYRQKQGCEQVAVGADNKRVTVLSNELSENGSQSITEARYYAKENPRNGQ